LLFGEIESKKRRLKNPYGLHGELSEKSEHKTIKTIKTIRKPRI
jgi:hypothetical protein